MGNFDGSVPLVTPGLGLGLLLGCGKEPGQPCPCLPQVDGNSRLGDTHRLGSLSSAHLEEKPQRDHIPLSLGQATEAFLKQEASLQTPEARVLNGQLVFRNVLPSGLELGLPLLAPSLVDHTVLEHREEHALQVVGREQAVPFPERCQEDVLHGLLGVMQVAQLHMGIPQIVAKVELMERNKRD